MSQYRKILLIADPRNERSPAAVRAARLAASSGAELRVGIFVHDASVLALGAVSGEVMELARQNRLLQLEQWLQERQRDLGAQGLRVTTRLAWGGPLAEKIVEEVLEFKPDLVIKDVAEVSALRRLFLTPLDWQLLRLCPAPLLLVNPQSHELPRVVLAAVDPLRALHETHHLHDHVIGAALDLALQCDADAHVMHAFEGLAPPGPAEAFTGRLQAVLDNVRALHRRHFENYAARLGVPADRMHFADGLVDEAVARLAAEQHADVVVVGSVRRTGLDRIVMGSSAERILGAVKCDVLAVKPDGFLQDLQRYLHLSPHPVHPVPVEAGLPAPAHH